MDYINNGYLTYIQYETFVTVTDKGPAFAQEQINNRVLYITQE